MVLFRSHSMHRLAVFIASSLMILLFWQVLPGHFAVDQSTDHVYYYEPLARGLLAGNGFAFVKDGDMVVINPPGYTVLVAGILWLSLQIGISETILFSLFSLLCMGGAAVLLFQTGLETWNSLMEGWISALFFISYPFILWLTKQPATELPFILFFYAAIYVFQRALRDDGKAHGLFFLVGILAGFAMLIRAAAFGIGLLFALMLTALRSNVSLKAYFVVIHALLLMAGNVIMIAPWEISMYTNTGNIILLGENSVPSIRDGLTFAVNLKSYRESLELPSDVIALQETYRMKLYAEEQLSKIGSVIWDQMKMQPVASIKLLLIKSLRSWYGTDSGKMEKLILPIQLFYAVVLALGIWFSWEKIKNTPLIWVVAVFTLYFWGIATLALSILRYTVPVIGMFGLILAPSVRYLFRRSIS